MLDKKIYYFLTVVNEGSFSAAARKLFISQPALSQQITHLENELGLILLDRSGYRPVLTNEGKILYKEGTRIKKSCDDLISEIKEKTKQEITVGFTGTTANHRLLEVTSKFKKQYPNTSFQFIKSNFSGCRENLQNKTVDIAFGLESTYKDYNDIMFDVLYEHEICVICSLNHPLSNRISITLEEIKNEEIISLSEVYGKGFYRDFLIAFKLSNIIPNIKRKVDSFDELVSSVSVGEGIAISSMEVVSPKAVHIIKLEKSFHQNNYVMAYLKSEKNSNIKKFIEFCNNEFTSL